jgi:hypothetical protein
LAGLQKPISATGKFDGYSQELTRMYPEYMSGQTSNMTLIPTYAGITKYNFR